jgi:hypothetical protein
MRKNLSYYVKSYKLLDDIVCNQTIDELKKSEDEQTNAWQQHTFYNAKNESYATRSGDQELDISYVNTSTRPIIMDKIWQAFYLYASDLGFPWWNSWQGYSLVRFNRYKETRLMAEHCDHIHSLFDGERKGIPVVTALGLLNNDYEGGDLVMWQDKPLSFEPGEIKVFPSNFLYPHRIDPVTEGTRYSFVSWAW